MKNTRLLVLLENFSKKELKEARKFVQTPFFNQREDVVRLFDYLVDCRYTYGIVPDKSLVYRELYGRLPYDDHKLRMTMSFLFKALEKYLLYQEIFADEMKIKTHLVGIYRQRGLDRHFEFTLKDAQRLLEKTDYRDAGFFENSYQLQLEEFQQLAARRRTSELKLQSLANNLDISYLAVKLKQVCVLVSHQTVYNTAYDFGLLSELLAYIRDQDLLGIPVIAVHYHCYYALTQPEDPSHFRRFRELVLAHHQQFPAKEIRDLYLLGINFCLRSYNEGNPAYLPELFTLYREGLQREYLFTEGKISRFTYRNIVTLGLIQQEYDWVERFLDDYQHRLEPSYRESMYSLCRARLEYSRKHYSQALQLLQKTEYSDLLLNLSAKTVMLKIYYETQEFDALDAHLAAMKTFLGRKKILAYHRENYSNMLRFTHKLLELQPYDRQGREVLKNDIRSVKLVAERAWLLEQV